MAAAFGVLLLAGFALVTWKWQDERAARADADAKTREIQEGVERLNRANLLVERARARIEEKRWAEAEADLKEAKNLKPDHSDTWLESAYLYMRLGLRDRAAPEFREATRLGREASLALYCARYAAFCLHCEELSDYRRSCDWARKRFASGTRPVRSSPRC